MPTLRQIGMGDFDHMQIDEAHRLYWDGQQIVMETLLTLNTAVSTAVIVAALSAFAVAAIRVAEVAGWIATNTS